MSVNAANAKIAIKEKKKEILELIQEVKDYCFNFPTLNISFSLPSFESDFDVIDYLMDLVSTILGKKAKELEIELTKWLIENVEPLEKNIRFNIKSLLKSCYACKINPRIAPWMFETDASITGSGVGIYLEIDQIDFDCMLKINPRSDVGRTLYNGPSDMNYFLYDVIQSGQPEEYVDTVTGKKLATFQYFQTAPTSGTTSGGVQNVDFRNNIINMKIASSYYHNDKNLIDFINDYLNSFTLFNTQKVVTQSMDLIFGVLTKKIKMDNSCVEKRVEFEAAIDKASKCGLDDPNIEIDNGFFEFTDSEVVNIKQQVRDRQKGIKVFKDCHNLESSIDFETLSEMNDDADNATDKPTEVKILTDGISSLSKSSTNNMTKDTDKNQGKYAFIEELIRALKVVIMRMTLSPKTMFLFISMYYMVYGQSRFSNVRDWMRNNVCLLRDLLQQILQELSQYLLIIVLRGLKILLKKFIKKKLQDKFDQWKQSTQSLLPQAPGCSGISEAVSNPDALANTVVDAGFDQAENAIVDKNNKQQS